MEKLVLFGAGFYAEKALKLLEKEKIEAIFDNDPSKWGTRMEGIPVCSPEAEKRLLESSQVIISVSQRYQGQIIG